MFFCLIFKKYALVFVVSVHNENRAVVEFVMCFCVRRGIQCLMRRECYSMFGEKNLCYHTALQFYVV